MPENLYRRGNVWWCRIQIRGDEVRRSLRTTVLSVAKKRRDELIEEAEHFKFHGETRHTWKKAVVEWSRTAPDQVKQSTLDRYLVSLKQVRPYLDRLNVDEITRATIAEIARREGVTNATRRRDLTAVSAVLAWCVAQGWREDNPAREWDRGAIRERREPIVLPSEADIDAYVAEAYGNFAKMIRWAQYTGMREEEAAGLERGQVNLKRRAADLARTKTSRPRSVPLEDRAIAVYHSALAYVGSPYVFGHTDGQRYVNVSSNFAQLRRRVIAKAKKAGHVPPREFRFHDLRHWFAVDFLRRGAGSIYELQKILGHASIKTTELYLDYLTPEEAERAKRLIQQ